MHKHNRDHRRMRALQGIYRRHTPEFLVMLRHVGNTKRDLPRAWSTACELRVLESRLPPEMVAWARLNR